MRVALISLEPWDGVWRRNQHLASQLVRQGLVSHLWFVEPPSWTASSPAPESPQGIQIVRPRLVAPKRAGGLRLAAAQVRRAIASADVLWINDPALGRHCLTRQRPALYDVTDDWRTFSFPPRILDRITRAEDLLARRARTVVCSAVLEERWASRYQVEAAIVTNGVDDDAWASARPRPLAGPGPHVGYIGTLHSDRLDLALVHCLASDPGIGTVHLVGPNALTPVETATLRQHPSIRLDGPVDAADVPAWTLAMDVLVSPHRVTPFTLSLDAIKSREYLRSGRPVVATPTSGFQLLSAPQLTLAEGAAFRETVVWALTTGLARPTPIRASGWQDQARAFAAVLDAACAIRAPSLGVRAGAQL